MAGRRVHLQHPRPDIPSVRRGLMGGRIMTGPHLLTTPAAAEWGGLSRLRVGELIRPGRVPAVFAAERRCGASMSAISI